MTSTSSQPDLDTQTEIILSEISSAKNQNFNEAQTRFKIIDRVVFEFLGWDRDDVNVEIRTREDGSDKFIDYTISTAQHIIAIEAKRIGADFSNAPTSRRIQLKGEWLNSALGQAIRQARDGARSKGAGFAGVTNGQVWVFFPVNRRDGIAFEDSSAIVFSSAESALRNSRQEFLSLFSRSSVISGSLDDSLLGGIENQKDTRRINQIYPTHFSKPSRTSLYKHIEPAMVTAFAEDLLTTNPEVIEHAYVQTPDRIRFDERIGMTIRKRDQVLKTRPMRPLSNKGLREAKQKIESIAIISKPTATVTLGLVGAGKTTFIHHLRNVSCSEVFDRSNSGFAIWIYCDFRDFSPFSSPRDFLYKLIHEFILHDEELGDFEAYIKPAYEAEIEGLKRGPLSLLTDESVQTTAIYNHIQKDFKDIEPYVDKVLSFISNNHPIYLVVDNVDQIDSDDVQGSIFSEAISLARNINAHLLLAMRDQTFVKNRFLPIFDAFDYDAFYIDSPPVEAVLSSRFKIAEKLLHAQKVEDFDRRGKKIIIDNAADIVSVLKTSILGTNVGRFISIASTGDIRLSLRMTRQFLQFGYSSSIEKYFRLRYDDPRSASSFRLAEHEAIRAIMLGNSSVYSDNHSEFMNIFDAKFHRSEIQFLRLVCLNAIVNLASDQKFEGVEAREIIEDLEKIGISQKFSLKVLQDLVRGRLIFTNSHQAVTIDAIISPTRLGGYTMRELVTLFVYLENMLYDTFISNSDSWSKIKTLFSDIYKEKDPTKRLKMRKEAVREFFDYCESEIDPIIAASQSDYCCIAESRPR
ncbi:hypothetical protein [Oceanicaulis sp.]|uniref:hypothetical protein n=1 Tax=Oceanicaulis sp. TaxID=1924941 RepID=UPI003D272B8A